MTKLFDKAVKEAAKLSPEEQDALAAILLEELGSERRWAKQFAASQAELSALADEARTEHRGGDAKALAPDSL